ncbi:beta-ketoacyl synthase N-terminal-like domain-containing protein [uncultured Bradyrhizobium sp.]|uniref:beta-ketoacyl synthase N-terminal-like domain-containing protein n=1 Tax=uncultured Bradyrhizobium sp. TaxID=199684 RepID=UPI0035C985F5
MTHPGFAIQRSVALRSESDGAVGEWILCAERRSPKVGVLSTQARLVVEATRRCLAGIERPADDIIGLSLGTLCGANDVAERCLQTAHATGIADVSASWYATGLPNSTTGAVASMAGLRGPNLTLLGYQAGLDAIIMACRILRAGRAHCMLAGGFDIPTGGEVARLRNAPSLSHTGTILAGIGLLLLANRTDGADHLATVVGWSYGESAHPDHDALIDSAIRAVSRTATSSPPTRHILSPGLCGNEYLAATCPIRLVEALTAHGESGLHAFIVEGDGLRPVCLVVDIPGSSGSSSGDAGEA